MRLHLWSDLLAPATILWLIGCGGSGTAHRDASSDGGGKEVPSIDGSHDSKVSAAIDTNVDARLPSSHDTGLIVPDSGGMDGPAEVARDANLSDSDDHGSPIFGDALDLGAPALLPLANYDFETDQGWGMFEELVDPSCYITGAGEVVQSTDVATAGTTSLRVTANKGKTVSKSNHVIGQKRLFSTGQSGTFRLEADAYIPTDVATTGQTGPEMSLQNTRQVGTSQFTTSTAGIQYIANADDTNAGRWGIWTETTPGVAVWRYSSTIAKPLAAGTWYHITLVANFDSNRYANLTISDGQTSTTFDLSAYRIAAEPNKFTEEAFWVTAEAENMWNNCGLAAATEYRVYYDNIVVRR